MLNIQRVWRLRQAYVNLHARLNRSLDQRTGLFLLMRKEQGLNWKNKMHKKNHLGITLPLRALLCNTISLSLIAYLTEETWWNEKHTLTYFCVDVFPTKEKWRWRKQCNTYGDTTETDVHDRTNYKYNDGTDWIKNWPWRPTSSFFFLQALPENKK